MVSDKLQKSIKLPMTEFTIISIQLLIENKSNVKFRHNNQRISLVIYYEKRTYFRIQLW